MTFSPHYKKSQPSLIWERGLPSPVAGVDEVGRGPLAGPVLAAAVILDPSSDVSDFRDSKALSKGRLDVLARRIREEAWVGVGAASVAEIEEMNILRASLQAMKRALEALSVKPAFVLIDGKHTPDINIPTYPLVHGDSLSSSIAAASIVAKVARDRLMKKLALVYPHYGWERNAGYPTREHKRALTRYGITPHHRRTFRPVYEYLSTG